MPRRTAAILILFLFLLPVTLRAQAGPSADQLKLLNLVNHERETHGLSKLEWNDHLAQSATAHDRLVMEHQELSHQFPGEPELGERVGATGLRFNAAGENLAYAPTIEEIHTGLMNSPHHRANILDPKYNAVGFGILAGNGGLYVTQNFAHVLPVYSEEQFRNAVVAAFNQERRKAQGNPIETLPDSRLRQAACGKDPQPNIIIASVSGASDLVVFTASVPEKLPQPMKRAANDPNLNRMNIGVCFRPGAEHGYGSFSVVAAFFQ